MDAVLSALAAAAEAGLMPPGSSTLLAVSGGADSSALLHGAAELSSRFRWRLAVGHVHHGWRSREADRDLDFVAGSARRLGLPFFQRRGSVREVSRRLRLSPEAAARHLRYEALQEMARQAGAEAIAAAHQKDDVLETLLIARRRRGGLMGLAGPRARRADGVVRPLLCVSRLEILAFLASRALAFRRDATNGDTRLTRTLARRELALLRASPEGHARMDALSDQASRYAQERDRLEAELAARILPRARAAGPGVVADAATLATCNPELARLALERLAAHLARPGRPPFTGREREQILARLAAGGDFRFEAGRRIRVERRANTLLLSPRETVPRVYDFRA